MDSLLEQQVKSGEVAGTDLAGSGTAAPATPDPATGLARQFDYSALRPSTMPEEVFQETVAQVRQAAAEGGFELLPDMRSAFIAAGGTEEAWTQIQQLALAETNPAVNVPDGAVPVTAEGMTETSTQNAGTSGADAMMVGEPGVNGTGTGAPKYIGMGEWKPGPDGKAPNYLEGSEVNEYRSLTASQRMDLKRQMYDAGLYGDATPQDILLGTAQWTEADRTAFTALLGEANANFMDWRSTLSVREQAKGLYGSDALTPQEEAELVDGGLSFQQNIKKFAAENGLRMSNETVRSMYDRVLTGETTLEQEQQRLREKYLVGMYPAWKDEILQGQNVAAIASPYVETMAAMLDVPPASIELSDPLVKRALQGVGEDGKPGIVPMWQFESQVRRDSRWQDSPEGMESVADSLTGAYNEMMGMFNG